MPNLLLNGEPDTSTPAPEAASSRPSRKKGSMALINFVLDATLLLSISVLGWVSVVMQVVFPDPTIADGWALWGLSYDQWRDVQFGSLCVLGLLAVEHLALHWNWVCGVIATKVLRVKNRPDDGIQAVYGVATFIGILTVMLAGVIVAMLTVHQPPG
jgi:hypothetical protein